MRTKTTTPQVITKIRRDEKSVDKNKTKEVQEPKLVNVIKDSFLNLS